MYFNMVRTDLLEMDPLALSAPAPSIQLPYFPIQFIILALMVLKKVKIYCFLDLPKTKALYQVHETWKFFFLIHIQLCVL